MAEKKKRKRQLKSTERKFIEEYLKSFNASKAYREAYPGTKPEFIRTYANRLKNRDHIQEEIKRLIEEGMTTLEEDVMKNVKFWIDMRDDPEAKEASRLKASEMLAKYRGQFTEKKEVSGNVSVQIVDDI